MVEARDKSGTRGTSLDTEGGKQSNKGMMVMGELATMVTSKGSLERTKEAR